MLFLDDKQKMEERNEIVIDLFGSTGAEVRKIIDNYSTEAKEQLANKISNHIKFYQNIFDEENTGTNYRILTAKLRIEEIYPQLLELLKS